MKSETYNGWTNYATWRISLEWFESGYDYFDANRELYQLATELEEYVTEAICSYGDNVAISYALAFISDVNWYEIAEHIREMQEA